MATRAFPPLVGPREEVHRAVPRVHVGQERVERSRTWMRSRRRRSRTTRRGAPSGSSARARTCNRRAPAAAHARRSSLAISRRLPELQRALGAPRPAARVAVQAQRAVYVSPRTLLVEARRGVRSARSAPARRLDGEERVDGPLGARARRAPRRPGRGDRRAPTAPAGDRVRQARARAPRTPSSPTTSRPRTASSERPVGDQSAAPSSRPSPQVTGWRPDAHEARARRRRCAPRPTPRTRPCCASGPGCPKASLPRRGPRAARPCSTTRSSTGPRSASTPRRARSSSMPRSCASEVAPVLAAHARLDDGRELPVAHRDAARAPAAPPAPARRPPTSSDGSPGRPDASRARR